LRCLGASGNADFPGLRNNHVMSDIRVMVDGVLLAPGEVPLIPLDDAVVRGDGVFEGLRLYGHRPRTLEAHLDRMERSADMVRLPFDRDLIRRETEAISAATSAPDCALRVMLTRGGHRVLREEALFPPAPLGWSVLPVAHRITPLLVASKTLSYAANMQAARLAAEAGADTALFVDADTDAVLECPVASFVWLEGDDLVAPPLAAGILDSITRRLISEVTTLHVRERTVGDLASADGALVISTVLESRIVREVQGVATYDMGGRRVNEIADALTEMCVTGDPDGGRTVPV
jgi:branched-subunit amino acid aminotransferase/4-amino-4-deoxychorismate lyase